MSLMHLSPEQAAALLEQNRLQLAGNRAALKQQEETLDLLQRARAELDPKPSWRNEPQIKALIASQNYILLAQILQLEAASESLKGAIKLNEQNIKNLESPILGIGRGIA